MKNNILARFIIYSCCLLVSHSLLAQEHFADKYNITGITMIDGLPHNFVDDIYQDSNGFLWISTAGGGLARYDGYEFVYFTPNTPHCKLQSNFIRNVHEDRFRRLWIASEGGIDIMDLCTLQSVQLADPQHLLTDILQQPATSVISDTQGNIWAQCGNTVYRIAFEPTGVVATVHALSPARLRNESIVMRDVDEDGKLWTGIGGQIYKLVPDSNGLLEQQPLSDRLIFTPDINFTDFLARDDRVWISTDKGLFRYTRSNDTLKEYLHHPDQPGSLSQNFPTDMTFTADKQLLIATLRGINIYNPGTDDFDHLTTMPPGSGQTGLNSNFVNCLLVIGETIWIGTESGGINKLTPKRLRIHNYRYDREEPASLSYNPVNAIYEDRKGVLWVGTVEGGLNRKERGNRNFTHYTYESGHLIHNSVSAITADRNDYLWIGTWGGGINLLDRRSPRRILQTITSFPENHQPLLFVGVLTYDPINNGIWIGTNRGLFFYDSEEQKLFSPFANHEAEQIPGCIGSIIDKEGNLWIGSQQGVYIIDLHSRLSNRSDGALFSYRHLPYKLDDPTSRLTERITCFCESRDGTLWLGSNGYGIYRRNVDKEGGETFTAYSIPNGLANSSVRSILEDEHGHLWIGTNNGLSCYYPREELFINYDRQDGLDDAQFYWNASCRAADGILYFGTVAGLTAIESLPIKTAAPQGHVRFTRLRIGNEEIYPGSEQLPVDIAVTRHLFLHERDKSFSLEFSALNYETDNTATYSYRLLGFDKEWMQVPGNRRFAGYTNLRPGNYTLQVKYTPDERTQTEPITELRITIAPFFYKTTWFLLLIITLAIVTVWQIYQLRIRNLKRMQQLLEQTVEKRTAELAAQNLTLKQQNEKITRQKVQLGRMTRKIQELTLDKIQFFTNITHEFRTPITLIIGPIERALRLSYNPQVIEQLNFVERNSKYLLSLVNQLMDFRKVESGHFDIHPKRGNFIHFMHTLLTPFESFAAERKITLHAFLHLPHPELVYDEEAMHKVLVNLLSNAIKFTPNGGSVSVYIATLNTCRANEEPKLYICVSDTGTGIPHNDIQQIFDRFYQSQNQKKYPMYGQAGSGIGLYLCKHIVQLHGGKITAHNNHTRGSSFRILIPLPEVPAGAPDVRQEDAETTALSAKPLPVKGQSSLTLLVVEDNDDMRNYIRSILREHYQVLEACNGEEALRLLETTPVDFIISDLMMPVMDGIELSRRVKQSFAISHIPFLMLTAKTSSEARLESYRMGVDEYLLKPFDETLLLTRIENILENRKRYQRRFIDNMDVEALHIEEESKDKQFIDRIMQVVKENYRNSEFSVSDFCQAVGISTSLMNRKLNSLIGQSAGQFIRNYRLNLAHALILKNRETRQMNINEISDEVGFSDPKYFSRTFTKNFNITPSELLQMNQ
ncbi:MAG: response regulator [Prevotellaceae bacterium]|nr:response regulator [Prevotellaceae bacterium]